MPCTTVPFAMRRVQRLPGTYAAAPSSVPRHGSPLASGIGSGLIPPLLLVVPPLVPPLLVAPPSGDEPEDAPAPTGVVSSLPQPKRRNGRRASRRESMALG